MNQHQVTEEMKRAFYDVIEVTRNGAIQMVERGIAAAINAMPAKYPDEWARAIHYPECWDTAAYPTLHDAIHEVVTCCGCVEHIPLAQEAQPVVDANDLLAAAEMLEQAARLEQNSFDEPPEPATEWDYNALQLAGHLRYGATHFVPPDAARCIAELEATNYRLNGEVATERKRVDELEAERDRLYSTIAASCDDEREQFWEATNGGGCPRALTAEAELTRLRAELAEAEPVGEIVPAQDGFPWKQIAYRYDTDLAKLPIGTKVYTTPPDAAKRISELEAEVDDKQAESSNDSIRMTAHQLACALEFAAPDYATDPDQGETEVQLSYVPEQLVNGEKIEAGLRIWLLEYPEEGSILLSPEDRPTSTASHAARRIAELEAERDRLRDALERIADHRNTHFAGDAQVVARAALGRES